MKLMKLGGLFLRVGATGFGGPLALLGLMQHQVVDKTEELTDEDFAEGVALGQMLPGPVAVDCATHLGHRAAGISGAIVSTLALILPAFMLMLIISPLYLRYGQIPQVSGFFLGVAPAVVAVVAFAGWRLGKQFVTGAPAAVIAVVVGAAALIGTHPILLILLGGGLGLVLRRPPEQGPNR